MTKPKAIKWLEHETGQLIDYAPDAGGQDRHLSVRLSGPLARALQELADERKVSVSQLVRELLADAAEKRRDAASLDSQALAARLEANVAEVRRRLTG